MARWKALLFLMLVASVPTNCEESDQKSDSGSNGDLDSTYEGNNSILDDLIQEVIKDLLKKYDGLHIPALPTLSYNDGDISVGLSLSDMTLNGILDLKVKDSVKTKKKLAFSVTFNKVYLDVGRYSSGGHLLNLPFAGEGPLLIAIHKLKISVEIPLGQSNNGGVCAGDIINGLPIKLSLDQRRLEVKFSNMNPGGDQGQLINIVLSSFGPDIIDYLNILLNGKDKEVADRIVVDVVNTALCPGWVSSNNPLDNRDEMAEYFSTIFQHFVEALKVPWRGFDIW